MAQPFEPPGGDETRAAVRLFGLLAGLAVFAVLLSLPPPGGLTPASWRVAATAALMVCWWITEALPIAATALVPLVAFPLLGVADMKATAAPYANPLIFLFLGGFLIAKAIERWGLHRRMALSVVAVFGTNPAALVGGFMAATAVLSMWLSNTATAIMMLPIGLSVIALLGEQAADAEADGDRRGFAVALLLGIAYGASIGGTGTLIGTPPNALLAAYLEEAHGVHVGFARWMVLAVPLAAVLLLAAWFVVTRLVFRLPRAAVPGAAAVIAEARRALGPMGRAERLVACVFLAVAALWVAQPTLSEVAPGLALSDSTIAILGALTLFAIPADGRRGRFLMDWEHAKTIPWGVLVLFGGGLSLASAIEVTGLAAAIGGLLSGSAGWPLVAVVLLVTALVVFLTEITSNTATASVFIPIAATLGASLGHGPVIFAVPVAFAASCAFMMPIATPPNAIVYASGQLRIPDMAKAGFWLNILATLVITAFAYWVLAAFLGAGVLSTT